MTWEEILAHLGFFRKGNQLWIDLVLYGLPPPTRFPGFISASVEKDINHPRTLFLLLPLSFLPPFFLSEARDVAVCSTESGSLPSGRIRPADITTLYFAVHSFSKGGTSLGSTTVPVLRAPWASFPHSLIRLAGSPIWQPRAPIWQSGYLCGGAISALKRRKWPKCWSVWYSVTPNGVLTKQLG